MRLRNNSGTARRGSWPRRRISRASAISGLTSPSVPKVVKTIRMRVRWSLQYDGSLWQRMGEVGGRNVHKDLPAQTVDATLAWAKLKGGKMRYVPMPPELAAEIRRYPAVIDEDRILPPEPGATSGRQRVEGSFEDLLSRAGIQSFRFHDLRHTFASWYMMNGGDLYELAKILGHSNIKMTERYAKLARQHIA